MTPGWRKLFKLIPGYDPEKTAPEGAFFDAKVAGRTIYFFHKHLSHVEGELAGTPFRLAPWQMAQVGCAFGWFNADGRRRYREVFDYEPRKNGKSTKCGGLVNLVAICDDEPGAQLYSAAADREQAALIYRQAKGMILNHPELSEHCRIYSSFKSIEYANNVVYKALSSDADTKHGFNTHFCIVDELHAHANRTLLDVLMTSTGSRRQPMVWMITTADFDRESICNEKYDYASKVRDGVIEDPSFLPLIYEASVENDWRKPETWAKANPNLGVSVSYDYLQRECKRAMEVPSYENTFKRFHLNIRTQNDVRWIPLELWDACTEKVDPVALLGRPCFGGLDLSTTTDITAFVLVFPPDAEDGLWHVLPHFFIPEVNAEKRQRRDKVPYMDWIREGLIHATPGPTVDYAYLRKQIHELADQYMIRDIGYDRWNASQIVTELEGDGLKMEKFGQGYASMSAPSKHFEKLIVAKQLVHGGNKVLRWMASHVSVSVDAAENIKPDKAKSTERIDGIVATVMAIGRAIVEPPVPELEFRVIG